MGPMVDQGVVEKSYVLQSSSVADNPKLNVKFTIRSPNAPPITSSSVVNESQSSMSMQAFPQNDQMQKTL